MIGTARMVQVGDSGDNPRLPLALGRVSQATKERLAHLRVGGQCRSDKEKTRQTIRVLNTPSLPIQHLGEVLHLA